MGVRLCEWVAGGSLRECVLSSGSWPNRLQGRGLCLNLKCENRDCESPVIDYFHISA